ncbi:hypothetical protein A5881_001798 [Enterococcus termitis]|nr:hypothetical protein A5881_001883 [Enterococcus termitis]
METKVRKVGNALGIILPKGLVSLDEKFEIEQLAGKIVLIPKKENDFYSTAQPLEYHREEEFEDIEIQGEEVW